MRVLVPRLFDRDNYNAQNLNAKALMSRFSSEDATWVGAHYGEPDPEVLANPQIRLVQLWQGRLWLLRMWLLYMQPAAALFYPGVEAVDAAGVRWRKRLYPHCPIIATLEGLAGNEAREKQLTEWAGHPVYCQRVDQRTLDRVDAILGKADHVVAISPFLAEMGQRRYGDKFSILPLGVNTGIFFPATKPTKRRLRVVSAGHIEHRKRPQLFLDLAQKHPNVEFVWYGEGTMRVELVNRARATGLQNVAFPGGVDPVHLAEGFRNADVFVMPSLSEGVPKVTQEAAACGLAQVVFGYYEAPTVVHGVNGFVVWSDEEFLAKAGELLDNPGLAEAFGRAGAEMALAWDWAVVAPRWRERLIQLAETR